MKTKLFIIIFTIIFYIPLSAQEEKKPEFVYKLGTLAPEGSVWMERLREIMGEIDVLTNGRVKTLFYPGGVMGDEPDMVKKMRYGQLQIGGFTIHGTITIAPEMAVMSLPFLFDDFDELDYIRKKMLPEFREIFRKKGFMLLSWVDQGGFINYYSKTEIHSPDDMKKLKVWAWSGEPVNIATAKALGVTPITTPVPEVLPSLQTGLIDTFPTTPLACLALQWYTQIKYIILLNMRYEPGVVVQTLESWNKAPEDIQRITLEASDKFEPKAIASIRLASNKSLESMVRQGIKLVTLTKEEKEVFKNMTRSVYNELAGKLYSKELLDKLLKEIDDYRAQKGK
jgi:TRAP-type C4-dicarboxylate transport system substrate-binding protein